ncbi:hypothetical protein [Simkania sp.]|uniref:hypothetical protein n=1 Tax=Simkania sp. TaxID=34094 RepID=UPI003B52F6DD
MTPVDPSSSLLVSIIKAPFQIVYDLVWFAILCVKWLFDTVYEFFNPPTSHKPEVTAVVDPNLIAIGEDKRGELAGQEKEAWNQGMDAIASDGVRSQKEFDLIHVGRIIPTHEELQRKQILHIQGTETGEEAKLYLTVRLPKSQLVHFPHDIRVRLKEFDQEQELELYFVIYDMSHIREKTFSFLYHSVAHSETLDEREIYTGVFRSEGLEPQRDSEVTYGQFSPCKVRLRETESLSSQLKFRLDQPYGSFFTAAQFVSEHGHNQKGLGIFGIVVRDWHRAEPQKIAVAGEEKSLRGFLSRLQELNFSASHTLSSLFNYNENYYFTGL